MIGLFLFINSCNVTYLMIFVIILTIFVLREIISITKTPQGYPLPIYLIVGFTTNIYIYYLSDSLSYLYPSLSNCLIIHSKTYFYNCVIFMIIFVCSLKKGLLKRQFALFSLIHLASYLVANSCRAALVNLHIGKFWLFFPSTLVICNDIFAYIIGKSLGHTPLFKLSPKKTVEGFIGGFVFTFLYGFIFCFIQSKYTLFVDLYSKELQDIWKFVFYGVTVQIKYMYIHCLCFVLVASFVAPFSGFFASALKRAYNKKDFGNSIPGHGGLTDRFDCQCIMVLFTTVYLKSFLRTKEQTLEGCYFHITRSFSGDEISLLISMLEKFQLGQVEN
ncbi:phosphatidate cytidylyltransferase [Vairimorpha necatrix]|uniref:Phosphatidate cytidylyltransferase n=1 Tax=Vairimorpha necatrix TaxID=6039 RepID=A0AAX4JA20_9MICR